MKEQDTRDALLGLTMFLAACLLPAKALAGLARWTVLIRLARQKKRHLPWFRRSVTAVLGTCEEPRTEALYAQLRQHYHRRWGLVMLELLPWRRPPHVEVIGAGRLHQALERGLGALVWTEEFIYQSLVVKRALWQSGLRPWQMSATTHGFSDTAFGLHVVNRPIMAAENRFLSGRLAFGRGEEHGVTRRLMRVLSQGGIVIMGNNTYSGTSFLELPFGENGRARMPTTALNIATRHGVPLFTVSAIEVEPLARYRVEIVQVGDPGPDGATASRTAPKVGQRERMAEMACAVRDHLLGSVSAHPAQFMGWHGLDRRGVELAARAGGSAPET